jgi:hypothetical protein
MFLLTKIFCNKQRGLQGLQAEVMQGVMRRGISLFPSGIRQCGLIAAPQSGLPKIRAMIASRP